MWAEHLARRGKHKLAIVVEKSVERLEYVGGRKVKLVENDPVAVSQCPDEEPVLEDELACCRIGDVRAEVFLDVGVFMVVDAHEPMTSSSSEVFNRAGLS